MRQLEKLINVINNFHKEAVKLLKIKKMAQSSTFVMPDDEDDVPESKSPMSGLTPYQELVGLSQQVSDKNLSYDLGLLAKMYQKAIDMNGGFAAISNAINNVFSEYLEDPAPGTEEEVEGVEDVLNLINNDIRKRAGGKLPKADDPAAIDALKKVRHDYQFGGGDEEVASEAEAIESQRGEAGEAGEGGPGFEMGVFDPTGGMGQEEARKGKGRGFYFRTLTENRDWAQKYFDEAQRYQDILNKTTDPVMKSQLSKIIELLKKLSSNISEQKKLFAQIQPAAPGAYPELEARSQEITEENKKLKSAYEALNFSNRKARFSEINSRLEDRLKKERDPYEKLLIEQSIEKNNLLASRDLNKREELKLRQALVRILKGVGLQSGVKTQKGAWWHAFEEDIDPTKRSKTAQDIINRYLAQIEEAKKKTKKLSDVHKERAATTKAVKESGTLKGLIVILGQVIASKKNDLKKPIKSKLERDLFKEQHIHFADVMQALNTAAKANNVVLVEKLTKDLAKSIKLKASELADNDPKIVDFTNTVKAIYDFRDICEGLNAAMDTLDSESVRSMTLNTISMGNDIMSAYAKYPIYGTILKAMAPILNLLEEQLQATSEEEEAPDTIKN